MGFLDRFRKKKNEPMPDSYQGIVDQEDYELIMELSLQYMAAKEIKVIRTAPGEVVIDSAGEEQHCYLDNLVRQVAPAPREDWAEIVNRHFSRLKDNSAAFTYFYKDFEYAAPLLRVLLKSDDMDYEDRLDNLVHRQDLPGTYTFLVIEFEEQFRFVTREESAEWETPEEELFAIALENLPVDEIEVTEYLIEEQYTAVSITSGDFAPALVLDLEARLEGAVGTYGSLVAIPSKCAAAVHPIEGGDLLHLVSVLATWVNERYDEDPSPINACFYWYYEGSFELFPKEQSEEERIVRLPAKLEALLNQSSN